MTMERTNPFDKCPEYETNHFLFRLVKEEDAEDLLKCYSDVKSVKIFNSDNCNSNFFYQNKEEVKKLIQFWIMEYNNRGYVRFAILDKLENKAIGTIEIFAKKESYNEISKVGVLRLDLKSDYEKMENLDEIFQMIDIEFSSAFQINSVITKAIEEADNRIKVLKNKGYRKLENKSIVPYDDYYLKVW